ncbi:MAG: hypothetical protein CVU48_08715 [Candidatus Cloacimonetes bacterium HGW-Cloacimonetes-1]|jgi:ADP-heptose:LPS heptosyltransferase|nr:MAG: hypothetical protein CVU48_08715 [Candidatus Cloacimonetes bacterium HGW-Cloacimonetes-1]
MHKLRNCFKILLMLCTWIAYRIKRASTPLTTRDPQKILVLYLAGMGDILCISPFLKSLRNKYPDSQLDGCFQASFCALQKDFYMFDHYIPHRGYVATLKAINYEHYDMILIPGWLMRNSVLAIFSNAASVLGFINDLSFSNRYLNTFHLEGIGIRTPKSGLDMSKHHLCERTIPLANFLGFESTPAIGMKIERKCATRDYAVLHAGARFPGRRWEPERFAQIADYLLSLDGIDTIYLIGDKDDTAINRLIMNFSESTAIIDQAGQLNLLQTKHLIAEAAIFIGNDSGPMHIAALCGVPTLGLLGPNFPHISGPLGTNSGFIFHSFACSGCNQRDCAYQYRCMNAITTTEVKNKVLVLLS